MDDFPGLLARDFGFKPQGKSAPMAPSRSTPSSNNIRSNHNTNDTNSVFDDHDRYSDVFGGPPKYSSTSSASVSASASASANSRSFDYDSIFRGPNNNNSNSNSNNNNNNRNVKSSTMPVFDKPVYDDDIFDGLPGLKTSSASSVRYDDVFTSVSASSPSSRGAQQKNAQLDDLLGNLGRKEPELRSERGRAAKEKDSPLFDDLLPGFGARPPSESRQSQKPSSNSAKMASNVMDDPFVVLESTSAAEASPSGMFTDPLEEISKLSSSGKTKVGSSFVSGGVFDDIGRLDSLRKSVPPILSENNNRGKDKSPSRTGASMSGARNPANEDPIDRFSAKSSESHSQKKVPVDNFQEPHQTLFDMPNVSTDFRSSSPSSFVNASPNVTNSQVDMSPRYEENLEKSDDEWLTVSDIPLFTQPTSAPPPSRPPPPIPARVTKSRSFAPTNARKKVNEFSSFPNSTQYSHSPRSARAAAKSPVVSQMDELEEFAMGRTSNNVNDHADVLSGENAETNSTAAASAAAMKEAMDRAEAKFRHAREVREREYLKAARSKEGVQLEKDEKTMQDVQEREVREKQEREVREKQERVDRERQQREREEEERRLEKERERAREIERERGKARQAVERATREARERAAAEARIKAERAAVEKAKTEARERAERAAVQRAQAEARERAAAEARDRAEKVAAEARERANGEAREREAREKSAAAREAEVRLRSERAAVERAAAEARERATAEARERAAAAARANQQKNDNDLESFFSMGSRPSSAPRPRANSSDPLFDTQFQSKGGPEAARRTSVGASSNIKKASSSTNIVDDLTSIFGVAPSSGGFQDVEGESEERRKARLERHQRTQERAAKALAEKNQRDLHAQREQAERHRMAETLDVEIKRWATGKEGNLRALLSTLQYVLWPECGWQPVSLTDLITGASVKKVYRKATLCIHPDKVQQKGATLQQKYVSEKVFDLLKEAWNKFNSEELF